jgi:predicted PurR-regulated permease PerM
MARTSGAVTYTELKLQKLYKKLGFWLQGQLVLCLAIFVATWIALVVLSWFGIDLPNKFTLALIA